MLVFLQTHRVLSTCISYTSYRGCATCSASSSFWQRTNTTPSTSSSPSISHPDSSSIITHSPITACYVSRTPSARASGSLCSRSSSRIRIVLFPMSTSGQSECRACSTERWRHGKREVATTSMEMKRRRNWGNCEKFHVTKKLFFMKRQQRMLSFIIITHIKCNVFETGQCIQVNQRSKVSVSLFFPAAVIMRINILSKYCVLFKIALP